MSKGVHLFAYSRSAPRWRPALLDAVLTAEFNCQTQQSANSLYALPVLVVDPHTSVGAELVSRLNDYGIPADIATSCPTAWRAARARYYTSLVLIADPRVRADMDCLANLRRKLPRTWIVLICRSAPREHQLARLHQLADALLNTPFSPWDLIFRLSAFSQRSRPP